MCVNGRANVLWLSRAVPSHPGSAARSAAQNEARKRRASVRHRVGSCQELGRGLMRSLTNNCYTRTVPFLRREAIPQIPTLVQQVDTLLLGPLFERYWRHPPEIVHYTSIESLAAILGSGNFRMSHFRYLNDSTEMRHGRTIANDLLEEETQRHDSASDFFNFCRFNLSYHDDDAIQYFVSSFSVLQDSAKLWNRYGTKGDGVAVVFDTKHMGPDSSDDASYHIAKVTYTGSEQTELLRVLIAATRTVLVPYINRFGCDIDDGAVQVLAIKLCSHLIHHSISLKDESWSVEREWRTVFLLSDDPNERARVGVRSDGRPYIDIAVRSANPDDTRMPIIKVIAGCSADMTLIRATLDNFGYGHVMLERSAMTGAFLAQVANRS
jgi:hypothetical protein